MREDDSGVESAAEPDLGDLRSFAPALARMQSRAQRAIIVGMNAQGLELARRMGANAYAQFELAGFFDDRSPERLGIATEQPLLGNLKDLPDFVKNRRIELIYLSMPMSSHQRFGLRLRLARVAMRQLRD